MLQWRTWMLLGLASNIGSVTGAPQNIDNIDTSQLPHQDINTLNCFDLVEESVWPQILDLNQTSASLSVEVSEAGQPVVTCLSRQTVRYEVSVVGDIQSQPYLLEDLHSWQGSGADLVTSPPTFPYLIYGGQYRLQVTHCGAGGQPDQLCSEGQHTTTVFSNFISVDESSSNDSESCSNRESNSSLTLSDNTAVFQLNFSPCSSVLEYDTANISIYSDNSTDQCGSTLVLTQTVSVNYSQESGAGGVRYQSPRLPGDRFYCASLTLSHISCRLVQVEAPGYCSVRSEPVWLPQESNLPIISFIIPLCTDHLACGWVYIVLGAGTSLLVSCILAICCVRCCDRCRGHLGSEDDRKGDEVDFSGEVISLAPVHDRISWSELHKEWDTREDKARGKILLLYSPDTKLFKELQEAFKSFLDLACHCDIYDLFDDALFDTIALDPSEWLQEFVNDEDVKILVISSAGNFIEKDYFCYVFGSATICCLTLLYTNVKSVRKNPNQKRFCNLIQVTIYFVIFTITTSGNSAMKHYIILNK